MARVTIWNNLKKKGKTKKNRHIIKEMIRRVLIDYRSKVKKKLVLDNPYIKEKYWEYYAEYPGNSHKDKLRRLAKIIQLNYRYRKYNGKNENIIETVDEFVENISKYEVISFDIFDTLLLRCVEKPVDVFSYMEALYHFPHFRDLRIRAEIEARRKSRTGEVNLCEIYNVIAKKTNIDIDEWMKREIQAEFLICMPNPYFKECVENLQKLNKRIIAVSDMYLSKGDIEALLDRCGYNNFEEIFISSQYHLSKAKGDLYEIVKQKVKTSSIIHIGDNISSDYVMAKKKGLKARYYHNVNAKYQVDNLRYGMSRLVGAFSKGMINAYLNNGLNHENEYFKYGMINGGLLTCGYCEYLNKVVREKNIDKIFFVARDGYIIKKVYDKYYRECQTEYMLFSRFCAEQILFDKYTEDYIKHNMEYRLLLEKKVSIKQILAEVGLQFLENDLKEEGIDTEEIFTEKNSKNIIDFIYKNKSQINQSFEETQENMYEYLKPQLEDCKNILIVDLGWFGTGGIAIKYLLEEKFNTGVRVYSALVGTNEDTSLEGRIANGELFPYAFSPVHDLYLLHWHTRHQYNVHNLLIELMFSAPYPSFLKFIKNEKGELNPQYSYDEKENYNVILSMHNGILKFAELYNNLDKSIKSMLEIKGGDAYSAFMYTADNPEKCYNLFKDYKISQLSGIFGTKSITTMGQIMKEDHYI